jgi:hypothetical protein
MLYVQCSEWDQEDLILTRLTFTFAIRTSVQAAWITSHLVPPKMRRKCWRPTTPGFCSKISAMLKFEQTKVSVNLPFKKKEVSVNPCGRVITGAIPFSEYGTRSTAGPPVAGGTAPAGAMRACNYSTYASRQACRVRGPCQCHGCFFHHARIARVVRAPRLHDPWCGCWCARRAGPRARTAMVRAGARRDYDDPGRPAPLAAC